MNIDEKISKVKDISIKATLKKISYYSEYVYLVDSDQETREKYNKICKYLPSQYETWINVINGGILFDIQLLSTDFIDMRKGMKLEPIVLYNLDDIKKKIGINSNMVIFAIASYGNVFCFYSDNSQVIIEWSIEEHKIISTWNNYSLWLNHEIDIAIELVNENVLLPLAINTNGV